MNPAMKATCHLVGIVTHHSQISYTTVLLVYWVSFFSLVSNVFLFLCRVSSCRCWLRRLARKHEREHVLEPRKSFSGRWRILGFQVRKGTFPHENTRVEVSVVTNSAGDGRKSRTGRVLHRGALENIFVWMNALLWRRRSAVYTYNKRSSLASPIVVSL